MIGILTALLSGALMSVQGVFNTQVTKATSLWVSTSFVQFTALLVCLVIWYFADGKSFMTLTQVPDKWTMLGGAWRCDRCIYHRYRNKEHEQPGTCESGDADRDLPADHCLCDRASGMVWRRKTTAYHAKSGRDGDRDHRCCHI